MTTPLVPGVRPPLLPRPISAYPGAPPVPASAAPPSGAASMPMPIGGLPGPPPMNPPPSGPLIPSSSSSAPAYYQVDPSVGLMATAAPSSAAAPQDGSSHSLPSDSNP
ncbi:hypothetical protein HPP92_021135 [Vanilla planifolia]|uniref:Uncharacterized protein n=1 Tax=Vanilla planifolia TaxID=51239 RepID=A0A835Q412_VANPL|nr:hypothetical protein HPP92_021135 [Vanilla planifolia]